MFISQVEHTIPRWALLALGFCILAWPLSSAAPRYRVAHLHAQAPIEVIGSGAFGINRHGDVAGYFFVPGDNHAKPFVYLEGTGFMALDELNGFGEDINDSGQVAIGGYVPGTSGEDYAWRYTPGVGFESLGDLGVKGGAVPIGINNLGQVVGYADTYFEGRPWQDAFLYTDGIGMVNLGHLTNRVSTATAINDAGQITGHSGFYVFHYTQETGMVPIAQGGGFAINNNGVVAGDAGAEAAIFENGTTRRLGLLEGRATTADGINDYKVVVGWVVSGAISSFIWTESEGMLNLDTLVEPGWTFIEARDINNNGQIAATATGTVAVRLDPIPPQLSIGQSASNRVVSWSPAWPGLVLESTPSLTEPDWQPMDTGGTNVVNLPPDSPQRFFRLNLDGIRGLCCAPE